MAPRRTAARCPGHGNLLRLPRKVISLRRQDKKPPSVLYVRRRREVSRGRPRPVGPLHMRDPGQKDFVLVLGPRFSDRQAPRQRPFLSGTAHPGHSFSELFYPLPARCGNKICSQPARFPAWLAVRQRAVAMKGGPQESQGHPAAGNGIRQNVVFLDLRGRSRSSRLLTVNLDFSKPGTYNSPHRGDHDEWIRVWTE